MNNVENIYELSSMQEGILFYHLSEPDGDAYINQIVIKADGEIDIEYFKSCCQELINHYSTLRTSVVYQKLNNPMQVILRNRDLNFNFLDISGEEDKAKQDVLETIIQEEHSKKFDFVNEILIRFCVIKENDFNYTIIITSSHIITDGWSISILLRDLFKLYSLKGNRCGQALNKTRPFIDYIKWLKSKDSDAAKDFWKEYLDGFNPNSMIPTTRNKKKQKKSSFKEVEYIIEKDIYNSLENTAAELGITLPVILQTIWGIILQKYNNTDDIVFGNVISGRTADISDIENMFGMFIGTIPVRINSKDKKTFKELAMESFINIIECQNFGYISLSEIQKCANSDMIFDHIFTYQNYPIDRSLKENESLKNMGMNVTSVKAIERSNYSFCLTFTPGDNLVLKINYDENVIDSRIINRIYEHINKVCREVARDYCIDIDAINIITKEEMNKLLYDFNDTDAEWPVKETIVSLFEHQVIKTPNRKAVEFNDIGLTYSELNCRANKLAQKLVEESKEGTNKIVCLLVESSIETIMGILGTLKAGLAYLPINLEQPRERVEFILQDSDCKLLLTQKNLANNLELAKDIKIICLDCEDNYIGEGENFPVKSLPTDAAYIIYTSGSSGKPKGVIAENKNVVRLFFNNRNLFDFNEEDVWTLLHSYSFDFSVWEMYGALLYGGLLVIVPEEIKKDPIKYLKLLKEKRVTILNQTPKYFYNLMNEELQNKDKELNLRYVIIGGDALNPGLLKEWRNKYNSTKLINMYGITETTVHVTYKEIKEEDIENCISNVGVPIPTTKVYILDRDHKMVPIGCIGEICVAGEGVSRGYLHRDDLTNEKFIANTYCNGETLYRSGDLGRFLPDGDIEYLGRMDNQVKIRGYRIELGEIESILLMHYEIKETVVIDIVLDGAEERSLCAYINSGKKLSNEDLRSYLSKHLPDYMIPAYFIEIGEIPLTANGKLNKTALPKPSEKLLKSNLYVQPSNETEKRLVEIWEDVLGLENIGVTDNFFALGGDSLKVIRIVSRVNNEFGLGLEIADIFRRQTIRELLEINKECGNENSLEKQWADGMNIIKQVKAEILSNKDAIGNLPDNYEDIYPLTPIESGMIYSSLINTEEPVYYDQVVYKVKIKDFALLIKALSKLVERHENLRTLYYVNGFSKPIKVVLKDLQAPLHLENISRMDETEQKNKIKEYLALDLDKRYKFEGDLLWGLKAFHTDYNDFYLILSFHHAMLDGWSKSTFLIELTKYASIIENDKQDIPQLKHSYKDYCAIELGRKISKEAGDFWREVLDGYARTSLPLNTTNRLKSRATGIRLINKKFDKDLSEKLTNSYKIISANNNVSTKSIYLSAFLYLLHICCFEDDIVSGVVSHARPEIEDADKILGCFLKTIPIRINVGQADSFLNLIKMVNDFLVRVKPYELHLTDIMKEIGETTTSANPIFDIIFNFTDFHVRQEWDYNQTVIDNGITISEGELSGTEMTNTLFDLELDKTMDSLYIQIKYNVAYFNDYDANYFLELYVRTLELISNDVNSKLIASNLISNEEKDFLKKEFNNTISDYSRNKTIDMLFEERAARTPDNIALRMSNRTMTYSELNTASNKLARHLMAKGVKRGDNAGLLVSRDFNMVIGMLSILKIGAAYVPVNPNYPHERQGYIFSNSSVQKVLVDKQYDSLDKYVDNLSFINIQETNLADYDSDNLNLEKSSEELAYIIYTSGSTGNPKGVMIEHHSAVNLIEWVNSKFSISSKDSLLFLTPMCFDLSVYDIFGTLAAGATVVIALEEEIQDADRLKTLLKAHAITLWDSVPSTMNHLINYLEESDENYRQNNLRLALLSGDWIPVGLPDRIKAFFGNCENISLGGATEGTVWSNYYKIGEVEPMWTSIPYGKPINNNFFYVLDKHLNQVPIGAVGNLYIGGVGVARGYMNDVEKTQGAFFKDPFNRSLGGRMYNTGDLGRIMTDGNIEFLGRRDSQFKIRGYRVELGEIENQLLKYEGIKEAAVVAQKGKGMYLCAFICSECPVDNSEVKDYLMRKLPSYMIPTYIVQLNHLPFTSNGKLDCKNLPNPEEMFGKKSESASPQNKEEEMILNIWKEVLSNKSIGVEDNFFDVGGDSLKATELISKVSKTFNMRVPMREVFERQTVRELAGYIREKATDDVNILPIIPIGR